MIQLWSLGASLTVPLLESGPDTYVDFRTLPACRSPAVRVCRHTRRAASVTYHRRRCERRVGTPTVPVVRSGQTIGRATRRPPRTRRPDCTPSPATPQNTYITPRAFPRCFVRASADDAGSPDVAFDFLCGNRLLRMHAGDDGGRKRISTSAIPTNGSCCGWVASVCMDNRSMNWDPSRCIGVTPFLPDATRWLDWDRTKATKVDVIQDANTFSAILKNWFERTLSDTQPGNIGEVG